ncbi:hypothetical protein Aph01nite_07700 [Acrocarpospora phusangensis]|uniref:RlpA-like protein double-psi beta-barrel domain-containing protein n=1 Tax=Acrocarpospora phusangensis TaxID=1070424 RepID=A0A919UN83_9ACTN|nr:hypothetical protein [Acrocarpospora phusangensis]GIH22460.1 hypothetical protein Aph01nite_07700 [Acrocarpospora phusangensis]
MIIRRVAVALTAALALGVGAVPAQAQAARPATAPSAAASGAADPIVTPQPGTIKPHKVRWTSAKPYKKGKKSRYLKVTWWSGPQECTALDHVKVKETRKKVTVTLYEGSVRDNGMCIAIAVKKATLVKLKSPLGTRRIVDGAKN